MSPPWGPNTEDQLVEHPATNLLTALGWTHVNAYHETQGPGGTLGRDNRSEVLLIRYLRPALERLNPGIPAHAVDQATEQLTRDRSALHYARANREFYSLLRDRIEVQVRQADGSSVTERLTIIDWDTPENNEFILVSQLWVYSDLYKRRADLVCFVNGIPLVFIELKAAHKDLKNAYEENLTDYRATIPHLFVPNGFLILSNGAEAKVGTVTSGWEYFSDWKKINSEGEEGIVSLETVLRGMCAKERLLDIVENFIAFQERPGGLVKLLARNHQYLGVNNALARMAELQTAGSAERGRLGVFWHTQGSGKTVSMLFFSQKVLRKVPGNWSFVIVTDRADLDEQAYREFSDCGVITEGHVQAETSAHLRRLLAEDHRYVFTLIQKFRTDHGSSHPVLSERSDVIVITDEAHRTQYDVLALNMRNALPNACFIGFTGTPLIAGEELTKQVFGDYVSIYNFADSVADHATVPLFFENRIPQLEIINPDFGDDLTDLVESADLDEAEERKLGSSLGRPYELITREARLDIVAKDIVDHFLGRGFPGKALVVSIDKATAIRTYNKVRKFWDERLADEQGRLQAGGLSAADRDILKQEVAYMRNTDMAVVVSQSQNEIAEMERRGLDIRSHRKRMVEEDFEARFKDPQDPFRIAFVCAMWTTGFDVPSCSTIYLDKPMRNHTLMQTIARANRVFPEKNNGLIVAYIDVFRDLNRALAMYATGRGRGDLPVADKGELVAALRDALGDIGSFCEARDVDLDALSRLTGFDRVAAGRTAVEALMVDDDEKTAFLSRASLVDRLFKAILPDPQANEFGGIRAIVKYLADLMMGLDHPVEISGVLGRVEQLLDESVAAKGYVVPEATGDVLFNLNEIDWTVLEDAFKGGRRRTAAEKLRSLLSARIARLTRLNPMRINLVERFEKLVADYNIGSLNVGQFFAELRRLSWELTAEEARAVSEGLTEEQLAIFDLLTRPAPELAKDEEDRVKKVAEELLTTLKREKLVIDWRKEQRSRAAVRLAIEEGLDRLPEKYTRQIYKQKCDAVYEHVFDSYWDNGRSIYDVAA